MIQQVVIASNSIGKIPIYPLYTNKIGNACTLKLAPYMFHGSKNARQF